MIVEELEKMKEENEKLMRLLIGKQRVIRDLQEEIEMMGNDIDVVREQQVEDEENNDEEEIDNEEAKRINQGIQQLMERDEALLYYICHSQ